MILICIRRSQGLLLTSLPPGGCGSADINEVLFSWIKLLDKTSLQSNPLELTQLSSLAGRIRNNQSNSDLQYFFLRETLGSSTLTPFPQLFSSIVAVADFIIGLIYKPSREIVFTEILKPFKLFQYLYS